LDPIADGRSLRLDGTLWVLTAAAIAGGARLAPTSTAVR
jgi:hypothetical protein